LVEPVQKSVILQRGSKAAQTSPAIVAGHKSQR
jgi:hypothetical protein